MTRFEITRDLITLVIAVFGAGLSLFNFLHARRRDQRSIRVSMETLVPVYGQTLGATFVRVTATNTGMRSVTVVSLGVELADGGRLASFEVDPFPGVADDRFPKTLADGEQASIHLTYNEVGLGLLNTRGPRLLKVFPVAEDSSGRKFRGKPWTVNPDEWATRHG